METLFDDTYTGPRWTYGLTYRPLASAQVPDGWILWSERNHPDFPHGTADYPFELSDRQVKSFELNFIEAKPAR